MDIKNNAIELKVINISAENKSEIIEIEAEKIQRSIDLEAGPLVKLALFKTDVGDHFLIVIHHLIVDGISWRILFEDFSNSYKLVREKKEIIFQDKTMSFKKWAEEIKRYSTERELLQELPYWREIENTEVSLLPKDKINEERLHQDTRTTFLELSEFHTSKLLKEVHKAFQTEINDILLTCLGLSVKEWTNENKVLFNLERHGREKTSEFTNVTRTIGWFTTLFPVILNMEKSEDLSYSIKNVKETLRKIPNKGIGYGILKYITPKHYKKDIDFVRNPEISFNYLGKFDSDTRYDEFEISKYSTGKSVNENAERSYLIDINGMITESKLKISVTYRKEFKVSTINEFLILYKENLIKVIEFCINRSETELTPSDLGDKDITIDQLENYKNKLRKYF